jgi:twitching motility two-component system response regulator PilH
MTNPIVLLVEDQEDFQRLLQIVLESEEYKVVVEPTAEKAIEILAEFRPSIIVTDVMMPGISGIELTRHVKNTPVLENIPVIVLTGGTKDLIDEAKQAGAVVVMQKPIEVDDLLQLIKQYAPKETQTEEK